MLSDVERYKGVLVFIAAWTFRAEIFSLTSLRRILVKLIGAQTWILSMCHFNPGCQKILSKIPLAADGVIKSYDILSTLNSGRLKQAYAPQTFTFTAMMFTLLSGCVSKATTINGAVCCRTGIFN